MKFNPAAITALRKERGLRPEHLAIVADRSASSIYLYESGEVDPPAGVVAKLAEALGVDPGALFTSAE